MQLIVTLLISCLISFPVWADADSLRAHAELRESILSELDMAEAEAAAVDPETSSPVSLSDQPDQPVRESEPETLPAPATEPMTDPDESDPLNLEAPAETEASIEQVDEAAAEETEPEPVDESVHESVMEETAVEPASEPEIDMSKAYQEPWVADPIQVTSSRRPHTWDIAFQAEAFRFETDDKWPYYYSQIFPESDKVKKKGTLYGMYVAKTFNFYEPITSWRDLTQRYDLPNFMKFEAEVVTGKLTYDSFLTGKRKAQRAWEFDVRGLAGYDLAVTDNTLLTPYVGFGYRRFTDKTGGYVDYFVEDYAKYTNRKSIWYIPVGVETLTNVNSQWDLGLKFEADIVVGGTVDFQLDEIPGPFEGFEDAVTHEPLVLTPKKAVSDIPGGYGFKASVRLVRKFKNYDLYIEPYYKYLHLRSSERVQAKSNAINLNNREYVSVLPDLTPYEPLWEEASDTKSYGIRAGIQF